MITDIKVNGFKSLNDFHLSMRKGLNILIGPNGSGKTNIISFFEFLSYLQLHEIHEAVSLVGGAGSILTKKGVAAFTDNITASIFGYSKYKGKKELQYEYHFTIKVLSSEGQIYFEQQTIKVRAGHLRMEENFLESNPKWDLDISVSQEKQLGPEVLIKKFNRQRVRSFFGDIVPLEDLSKSLQSHATKNYGRSIVSFLSREYDLIWPVLKDLVAGEVFNIIPSKVKQPEDIAKQPGIKTDGTGLAATLFAIQNDRFIKRSKVPAYYYHFSPRKVSAGTYKRIISLAKLANVNVQDIQVINNTFDNQLILKVIIKTNKLENIVLPLSSMSDGTIKWITLITAILSSNQIFSIEEPENFLHPWMQSEIIKIMRGQFDESNEESFVLMSTHSETLLNNSDPEEVVVVFMENGNTVAKRLKNVELLRREISNTGFGLGFYYLSGALENE